MNQAIKILFGQCGRVTVTDLLQVFVTACALKLCPLPQPKMRDDLEKRLLEDFPELYSRGGYFACNDGWEPLLRRLSERITRIVQSLPLEAPTSVDNSPVSMGTSTKTGHYTGLTAKGFRASVVKEKFGELRFYMNKSTREIQQVIQDAEEESLTTCEVCGRPGEHRSHTRWYFVGCDEHSRQVEGAIEFSV